MSYPASPRGTGASRIRLDPAQYWAGAAATTVVAALIALVGILISRWTLNIPIMAPAGDGAWGNAHTGEYVLVTALIAVVAAGLLYLLRLGTPDPGLFFNWIMGLATLAAVVYPFSTSAPIEQKVATAIVDLVLGIAITSLLTAVAARAVRRVTTSYPPQQDGYPQGRASAYPQALVDDDYPQPGQGQGYQGQGYAPGQQRIEPTQPIDPSQRRGPRP
jgi:hypothetical protein